MTDKYGNDDGWISVLLGIAIGVTIGWGIWA